MQTKHETFASSTRKAENPPLSVSERFSHTNVARIPFTFTFGKRSFTITNYTYLRGSLGLTTLFNGHPKCGYPIIDPRSLPKIEERKNNMGGGATIKIEWPMPKAHGCERTDERGHGEGREQ